MTPSNGLPAPFAADTTLHLLSIVETAHIPLCIFKGAPIPVTTKNSETERWFSAVLLGNRAGHDESLWWQDARADSSLGVLVAVKSSQNETLDQTITELLFYAAQNRSAGSNRPPTPPPSSPVEADVNECDIQVFAQPLCSHRLSQNDPTPPSSPGLVEDAEVDAVFLPLISSQGTETGEVINLPPTRKRKTLDDTFNEAAERRKISRRKGDQRIAAESQAQPDRAMPTLKHRRSVSSTQPILQSRPLSRASSVASMMVTDARESSVPAPSKRSSLARVHPIAEEESSESKNKELVSKLVMAGMRIFGIVQSKTRKSRTISKATSSVDDASIAEENADRLQDEEYKLIYHQVYKGVCFAFRHHIAEKSLLSHTEALREMADRLLGVFTSDPFAVASPSGHEEITPGGRTAFGSSALPASEKNPFLTVFRPGASQSTTPCTKKPSIRDKVGLQYS